MVRKRYYEQVQNFKNEKVSDKSSDTLRSVYNGNNNGQFELYSYNTPIAFKDRKTGKVYLNKDKYTNTTSQQQNEIRSQLSPIELPRDEFEKRRKEALK